MGTITVTNLGKAYKQYPNRWSRLVEWVLPGAKLACTVQQAIQRGRGEWHLFLTTRAGNA